MASTCKSTPASLCTYNYMVGVKDHASIWMHAAEVDKIPGRFDDWFKTYAICRTIAGEASRDSILQLAKAGGIVLKEL